MKILNIKFNLKKIILALIIVLLLFFVIYLIFSNRSIKMTNKNYTKILQDSHNNINDYLGKRITTSGYIFRRKDFEKGYFVIARDMLINEKQANIVGFLCLYEQSDDFEDNEWVEASGTIILGDYFGPIPIIKIDTIKKIITPNDIYVYPPKSLTNNN